MNLLCFLVLASIYNQNLLWAADAGESKMDVADILKDINSYITSEVKAETESLTKRLSATSSTSTSPSPKNQKKVADEKDSQDKTIDYLQKILENAISKRGKFVKRAEEGIRTDDKLDNDIEKKVQKLEDIEIQEAMDNYEFFHHDANATAKNNKRDENEIESAWKEYRKMMSLTNDEEIELLTTPKGLKGKNDNVDNRNDKRDDDKDGYAKKEDSCKDVISAESCQRMKDGGFCERFPAEMRKRCAYTCQFCCGDTNFSACVILNTVSRRVKISTCHNVKYVNILKEKCPKVCGFCGNAALEPPCVRSTFGCCWEGTIASNHVGSHTDGCPECKDRYSSDFCRKFRLHCNEKYSRPGRQIRHMCPRSCRRCGPHKICRDELSMEGSCQQIKHEAEFSGNYPCVDNFHVMRFNCPKTCEICHSTTIACSLTEFGCCPDGKTIAKDFFLASCKECTDNPDPRYLCKLWKDHKVCKTHEYFMRKHCGGSCQFCL